MDQYVSAERIDLNLFQRDRTKILRYERVSRHQIRPCFSDDLLSGAIRIISPGTEGREIFVSLAVKNRAFRRQPTDLPFVQHTASTGSSSVCFVRIPNPKRHPGIAHLIAWQQCLSSLSTRASSSMRVISADMLRRVSTNVPSQQSVASRSKMLRLLVRFTPISLWVNEETGRGSRSTKAHSVPYLRAVLTKRKNQERCLICKIWLIYELLFYTK